MRPQSVPDEKILAALRHLSERGIAPTYAELAYALKFASASSARYRVMQLEKAGKVRRVPGSPRSMVYLGLPEAS